MQPFDLAVDVGCGSGHLASSSVLGTDVSPDQQEVALEHATAPNVSYRSEPPPLTSLTGQSQPQRGEEEGALDWRVMFCFD